MKLTRRKFVGAVTTALLAPSAGKALAGRFVDETGLNTGSFIWQPTYAPSGPVSVIASYSQKIVHVFRGDRLLGIAKCLPARAPTSMPSGIFRSSTREAKNTRLMWSGRPVFDASPTAVDPVFAEGALSCLYLPPVFANLLHAAMEPSSVIVMAPERTPIKLLHTFAPLPEPDGNGWSSQDHDMSATSDVAAFSFANHAFGPLAQINIVISAADRKARISLPGRPSVDVDIVIKDPRKPLGRHAYSLVKTYQSDGPATWLAVGLGQTQHRPEIKGMFAHRSLERISFVNRAISQTLLKSLTPGASIVLTDAPLPPRDMTTPPEIVLLAAGNTVPDINVRHQAHIAQTSTDGAPPPTKKPTAIKRNKQHRRKAVTRSRKPRAKVAARPSSEPLIGPKNFQDPR